MKMKKRNLLFALVLLLVLSFAACGSPSMPAQAPDAARDAAPVEAASPPPAGAPMPTPGNLFAAEDAETDYFLFPILTPDQAGDSRLVYTVSMRLQTTDFQPGMRTLQNAVADAGGHIVSADVRGHDMRDPSAERSADFRFRVPSAELAAFIVVVENHFNIWDLQQDRQEVTAQYQQTDWWLEDLQEQEALLLELLEDAAGEDYRALRNALRDVQSTIRSLEADQGALMENVIFSTVDIHLSEVVLSVEDDVISGMSPWIPLIVLFAVVLIVLLLVLRAIKRASQKQENGEV